MLPADPVNIFYIYSRDENNKELKRLLDSHLQSWNNPNWEHWDYARIKPGEEWDAEIKAHLNNADIIILLISADFMASTDCYREMTTALARHNNDEARVIPVIFRPVDWDDNAPFRNLKVLPTDGRPITQWTDKDEACSDVKKGVTRVVRDIQEKRANLQAAHEYFEQGNYKEALRLYNKASRAGKAPSDKSNVDVLLCISNTQLKLGEWVPALNTLKAYEDAIGGLSALKDPSKAAEIYANKGVMLFQIDKLHDALLAFSESLRINRDNANLWRYKGFIHARLQNIEEVRNSFAVAIELKPYDAGMRKAYADILLQFKYPEAWEEAWAEYNQVIELQPDFPNAYESRARACRMIAQRWIERAQEDEKRSKRSTKSG